jgi:tetratricopeptide (TPR) repeat protein
MLRFAFAFSLVGFAAQAAHADDAKLESARIHMKAAIAYYDDGRYEEAAREMRAAYELKPVPDLQYNLAQCYERLGRFESAAASYARYLEASPEAPDRATVEKRIAHLRERGQAERAGQAAPPLPAEKVVFKTIVVYRDAPPAPGRAARWAGYGAGVLGLAALGTGIAASVLASNAARDINKGGSVAMPPIYEGPPREAQDRGQTYQIVAIVGYSVAGIAAAGAVGLFLIGRKIDREAPKLSMAPALGPSGGGLVAMGRF